MAGDQVGTGVWSPARRSLTAGLVLAVTMVGFESLSVATVLPVVSRHLHGVRLYGWVFSAYFLGSLIGIVVAGGQADRDGLRRPFTLGLALFGGGLAVAGASPSMTVLVGARAVQGFGAGAVTAAAYVAIGLGYPSDVRPRMFAVLSSAWVIPGLVGPALAGYLADRLGWRWVFVGLLPLVAAAAAMILPQTAGMGRPALSPGEKGPAPVPTGENVVGPVPPVGDSTRPAPVGRGARRSGRRLLGRRLATLGVVVDAARVAAGTGLVLAGLTVASPAPTVGLVGLGGLIGLPAYVRLVPAGTLRARPGLAAAVAVRGVLAFAFFGADAYVPLTLTSIRGASPAAAGVALTVSSLTWTLGSWVQERRIGRWGPRCLVLAGFALVLAGIGGFAAVMAHGVPLAVGPATWALAGLGMGIAYSPISVTVLQQAKAGREGKASASMQLNEVVGIALGTGVGGAMVAFGHASGWDPRLGLMLAFALCGATATVGLALACRLPARLA